MTLNRRRDPAGFAYNVRGVSLVQVNRAYTDEYDALTNDGLYRALIRDGLMAGLRESGAKYARTEDAYRVLRVADPTTTLTYPYEWTFGMWKAAALAAIDVAEIALEHDMVLRRCSPFMWRFEAGMPTLTDPLAFGLQVDGRRWGGYPDFVRSWLGPLALMALVDPSLGVGARVYPAGHPTTTVSAMLPVRTRVNLGLTSHIHLAGRDFLSGQHDRAAVADTLTSLRETVEGLRYVPAAPTPTIRGRGDDPDEAVDSYRRETVRGYLRDASPTVVWDMWAGDGDLAWEAATVAAEVVAFTASPADSERLWARTQADEAVKVTPALTNWTNPAPNLGWRYRDARAVVGRAAPDLLLAFGWVHRMVLEAGLTFADVAALCAKLAPNVIVEFTPASDPHVIALLDGDGAGDDYTAEAFEAAFSEHYEVAAADGIPYSDRLLYRFRRREI